jgi:hypothetical protein
MRILLALAVLVVESVVGTASAALKPIDTDVHPVDNKAVAVYKATPQGDSPEGNMPYPWGHADQTIQTGSKCAGGWPTGGRLTA